MAADPGHQNQHHQHHHHHQGGGGGPPPPSASASESILQWQSQPSSNFVMVANNGGSNTMTLTQPLYGGSGANGGSGSGSGQQQQQQQYMPIQFQQSPIFMSASGQQVFPQFVQHSQPQHQQQQQKMQWFAVPTSPQVQMMVQASNPSAAAVPTQSGQGNAGGGGGDNQSTPGTFQSSSHRSNPLNDFNETFPMGSRSPKRSANSSPVGIGSQDSAAQDQSPQKAQVASLNVQMNLTSEPQASPVQLYQMFQGNSDTGKVAPPTARPSGTPVFSGNDASQVQKYVQVPQSSTAMFLVPSGGFQQQPQNQQQAIQVFQMQISGVPQSSQAENSQVVFQPTFYSTNPNQQFAMQSNQASMGSNPMMQMSNQHTSQMVLPPIADGNDPKGKRKRSAFVEELRFCGMHKDSNFIRVWMDSYGKVFYDCICGGRKGVQDIKKIERHIATHQVAKHKCEECGKAFPRYLQLNAHKRIHRNKSLPKNQEESPAPTPQSILEDAAGMANQTSSQAASGVLENGSGDQNDEIA